MIDRVNSVSLNRQQPADGPTTGSVLNARDVKAWQDAFEFLSHAEKQIAEQKTEAEETASVSMKPSVPGATRTARRRRPG